MKMRRVRMQTGSKETRRDGRDGRERTSHLDALHRLVDGLQQSPVLRVLVAVFVGEHVSESFNIRVQVLLRHGLLLGGSMHVFTSTTSPPSL